MEQPAGPADPLSGPRPAPAPPSPGPRSARIALLLLPLAALVPARVSADALADVHRTGRLRYGADREGGAPYAFPDPGGSGRLVGFEVELMRRLAARLGARAEFDQQQWDRLLQVLETGRVDVVVNGYELTEDRLRHYLATRPYGVYGLQLIARRDAPFWGWEAFRRPRGDGSPWRIGVLSNTAADRHAHELAATFEARAGRPTLVVRRYDGTTDAMTDVDHGRLDATIQDDLAARYYLRDGRFGTLKAVGPPQAGGYYVMYLRPGDEGLRDALDAGIAALLDSGELRAIYERFGIWSPAMESLEDWSWGATVAEPAGDGRPFLGVLPAWARPLAEAAGVTVLLSVLSMPLAMAAGLVVALGRRYGPPPLRWAGTAYVELIRGTPLLLQLFIIYFVLPEVGIVLPDLVAGVLGLAVNYSAYEAEIYRTGLQAIPAGQMEAALALGMPRPTALRRVVLPQAFRLVIPPMASDFITLFKDSSVCSMIGVVELTKQYSIVVNNAGHAVGFGATIALMYLAMSLPLSRLAHALERRLDAQPGTGGAA